MQRPKNRQARATGRKDPIIDSRRPFIDHARELRRRLIYVAISIGAGSVAAYSIENQLVAALLRPAHSQQFIYTSPAGGVDFLFRVSLYTGIALSIPVIVYQALRYIEPLIKEASSQFIFKASAASGVLALIGMAYGYFWGLPSALNFLSHQFVTQQIKPLVTIQSYMAFVTVYMLGAALLLQVPLIMICINRIKPTKPKAFLKYERHVIVGALIISGLMNPTPNIFELLLIAAPMILMYQVGILIIWQANRKNNLAFSLSPDELKLMERDLDLRARREEVVRRSRPVAFAMEVKSVVSTNKAPNIPTVSPAKKPAAPRPVRRYISL